MQLTDFSTLTFDCYGTLIDWESGMLKALEPLTDRLEMEIGRDTILAAHARYESTQQAQTPAKRYPDILAIVYKRLAEEWTLPVSWDECLRYGQSVKEWPAFPDSADALAYLKEHYRLVILSNVDNASFAASNKKLGVTFDAIYTAEEVGSYKPSAANFDYLFRMLKTLNIEKSQILHTAESLFHDHAPANRCGLKSCWIHRRHEQEGFGATINPGKMPHVDFQFTSMAAMAEAHARHF